MLIYLSICDHQGGSVGLAGFNAQH